MNETSGRPPSWSADGRTLSRRDFMQLLGAGAATLTLGQLLACTESGGRRPNIVFILTDDHRFDAMGCAGDTHLQTPHLDRLADEGVRFTNAFTTTSLCSPSRASFLTGCYAHNHGVIDNETNDYDPDLRSFPELLQEAGYETAFIGKWHMLKAGMPRPGFDHWVGFTGQGEYEGNTLNVDGKWELSLNYVTDELTARAEDFLRRDRDQPFLLYLSHKASHQPFVPAPRHAESYADVHFADGHDPNDRLDLKPDWGERRPDPERTEKVRQYHRCLLSVDEGLGRILATLTELDELDNTVIVYAGDNGYLFGEHGGLLDKRTAYEPSIRIPLLMRYPGLTDGGVTCSDLVLNIDLAPTLLELASVPVPGQMDGTSWVGVLNDQPGREAFLYEYFPDQGAVPTITAVRTTEWKYVAYPQNPDLTDELYHLKYDPDELLNRIDEPKYGEQAQQMRRLLEDVKQQTGYKLPTEPIDRS